MPASRATWLDGAPVERPLFGLNFNPVSNLAYDPQAVVSAFARSSEAQDHRPSSKTKYDGFIWILSS